MESYRSLAAAILLTTLLLLPSTTGTGTTTNDSKKSQSVKKGEANLPIVPALVIQNADQKPSVEPEQVVVISEKLQHQLAPVIGTNSDSTGKLPSEDIHIEPSNAEFPDTYAAVFYILVGITSSAIVLLLVRIYRLRLSRAERKYGVQGDRANQELTPLPMAIEDVNSDEDEDHTLFEVNRQSIRIL